jgi:hypothetical protein
MGFVPKEGNQEEHRGAKIMMSFPYDNGINRIIRIWGWIPRIASSTSSRDEILSEIYGFLEKTYDKNFVYWSDFNPEKYSSVLEYLEKRLLKEAK